MTISKEIPRRCLILKAFIFFPATGVIQSYTCCQGDGNSEGCQVHECHVTDILDFNDMRGFVSTMPPSEADPDGDYGVFALDCEMCNTVMGNELTRVTVVNLEGKTVYETLVMPENEIIDYNTREAQIACSASYSGCKS